MITLLVMRALAAIALIVLTAQIVALRRWPRAGEDGHADPRPITVLKPLCGADAGLYESLRSFCCQDYPRYQLVFGVHSPQDPAIAVVERLRAEFPDRDLTLVVDPRRIGPNAKVSNLANMLAHARYDLLVLADADIHVGPDYLRSLAGPLQDPSVGIVTCLYRGQPVSGFWSRIEALFIQDWFVPQVLLAHALGSSDFAFGATIGLRREVLEAIGGFAAVSAKLADDYELGARTRALGLRTVLSPTLVTTTVDEPRFRGFARHELRWLKTIRLINPWGYAFSFLTWRFPLPLVAPLVAHEALVWGLAFLALVLRLMLHFRAYGRLRGWRDPVLAPLADCVLCGLWAAGFVGQGVTWRGATLEVGADGSIKANRE